MRRTLDIWHWTKQHSWSKLVLVWTTSEPTKVHPKAQVFRYYIYIYIIFIYNYMFSSYLLRREHSVYFADLLKNMFNTRLGQRRSDDKTIFRFARWPVALHKICFVIGRKTYDEKKQLTSDQCVGVSQNNKFVIRTET